MTTNTHCRARLARIDPIIPTPHHHPYTLLHHPCPALGFKISGLKFYEVFFKNQKFSIDPGNSNFSEIVGLWEKVRKPLKPMENQSFHCQNYVISAKTSVFTMFGKPKDALKSLRISTVSKKTKKSFKKLIDQG